MSVCFALKEVVVQDSRGIRTEWKSSEKGFNKPQNTRPLALFPAKEDTEFLKEFIPKVEDEVKMVKAEGVEVRLVDGCEIRAKCGKAKLSMVDGKMVTNLLQLGGAYCSMCTNSQQQCHSPTVIETGFVINRSIESLKDLALSLADPETGEVVTHKGDYETRQGLCDHPITESDLTKNIPVCHSKIRSFSWVIDLIARHMSHQKWWSTAVPVKYTAEDKEDYAQARQKVKTELWDQLAVNVGNPGDMVTGNAFQAFSSDHARGVLCGLVDEGRIRPI